MHDHIGVNSAISYEGGYEKTYNLKEVGFNIGFGFTDGQILDPKIGKLEVVRESFSYPHPADFKKVKTVEPVSVAWQPCKAEDFKIYSFSKGQEKD